MADEKASTVCSFCGRAVWSTDVNTTGRCVLCEGEKEPLGGEVNVGVGEGQTPPAGVGDAGTSSASLAADVAQGKTKK